MEHTECILCCEPQDSIALLECGHNDVCWRCLVRLQSSSAFPGCPVCKNPIASIALVQTDSKHHESSNPFRSAVASSLLECDKALLVLSSSGRPRAEFSRMRILASSAELRASVNGEIGVVCPVCRRHVLSEPAGGRRGAGDGRRHSKRPNAQSALDQLRSHLRKVHGRFWCDVCLAGRQQLLCEQRTYTRDGLADHNVRGDPELDGVAPIPPHPYCGLCRLGFMHSDELFAHLEREHVACRVCLAAAHAAGQASGSEHDPDRRYFSNHRMLMRHQADVHYRCGHPGCREDPHAAFATSYQLEAHAHEVHGAPPPRIAFAAHGEDETHGYRRAGGDRRHRRAGAPSVLFTPHTGRAIQLGADGSIARASAEGGRKTGSRGSSAGTAAEAPPAVASASLPGHVAGRAGDISVRSAVEDATDVARAIWESDVGRLPDLAAGAAGAVSGRSDDASASPLLPPDAPPVAPESMLPWPSLGPSAPAGGNGLMQALMADPVPDRKIKGKKGRKSRKGSKGKGKNTQRGGAGRSSAPRRELESLQQELWMRVGLPCQAASKAGTLDSELDAASARRHFHRRVLEAAGVEPARGPWSEDAAASSLATPQSSGEARRGGTPSQAVDHLLFDMKRQLGAKAAMLLLRSLAKISTDAAVQRAAYAAFIACAQAESARQAHLEQAKRLLRTREAAAASESTAAADPGSEWKGANGSSGAAEQVGGRASATGGAASRAVATSATGGAASRAVATSATGGAASRAAATIATGGAASRAAAGSSAPGISVHARPFVPAAQTRTGGTQAVVPRLAATGDLATQPRARPGPIAGRGPPPGLGLPSSGMTVGVAHGRPPPGLGFASNLPASGASAAGSILAMPARPASRWEAGNGTVGQTQLQQQDASRPGGSQPVVILRESGRAMRDTEQTSSLLLLGGATGGGSSSGQQQKRKSKKKSKRKKG